MTLAVRTASAAGPGISREVAVGSIGADTAWHDALRDARAVVHLAAHVHVAPERARGETATFEAVNHRGAVNLFRQAAEAGIGLFVFVSSVTVLGAGSPPGAPFDDRSPPAPETPYARSKLAAELALTQAAAQSGTRLVILRPPLVVGPGVGGNLLRLIRLAAMPVPLPLGGIRNRRSLLSRDNLVAAITAVLDRGAAAPAGTFLLTDRGALSTSDIVRALRAGLGRSRRLWPCPVGTARSLLEASGRRGLAERLFGDLEIDASGFRETYGWAASTETVAALQEAARCWRAAQRGR